MLEQFRPIPRIPVSIESARLLLRKYRTQDLEEFHALYSHGLEHHLSPWAPRTFQGLTHSQARNHSKEHLYAAIERWEDGTDFRFFITGKTDKKIIGQIAISGIVRNVSQSATIGYWIGYDHLNKGYATEACAAILFFAFEYLKLHRLSLWISPHNFPSLKIAEKLMLRYEGRALRALFLGGYWQDTDIYAITSEEWNGCSKVMVERYGIISSSSLERI